MDKSKQASLIYNKIAKSYSKKFSNPSDYIDEFLTLIPKNGKILDVGCGPGIDANYMNSKGFKVTGIDLSEKMLKLAKQKFPNINFKLSDVRTLDFPNNSFEGIFASFSLIHISKKDISLTLKKLYKILKENGVIYIALQSGESNEIYITEPLKPDERIFLNIIPFNEINDLLIKTGFFVIKKFERKPKSEAEFNFVKLFVLAKKI